MACETESNLLSAHFLGSAVDVSCWSFEPVSGQPTPEHARTATASTQGIAVEGGQRLVSPSIGLRPQHFYRLDLDVQTQQQAYWGVKFFKSDGTMTWADHYGSLEPSPEGGVQTFFVRQRYDGSTAQLWLHPQDGDAPSLVVRSVCITPVEADEVLAWADRGYGQMPPIKENVTPRASEEAPLALSALAAGKELRIVMVGDSIMNDTSNSAFDLLLNRAFPGAKVSIFEAVRNGGNATHFADQATVKQSILRLMPDLIFIGGISHQHQIRPLQALVERLTRSTQAEIVLATGPAGVEGDPAYVDPKHPKRKWQPAAELGTNDWRLQLRRLAQEQGVGYVDFETPWRLYVRRVDEPYSYFMRDPVHLNARGRQIVARLMLQFFGQ